VCLEYCDDFIYGLLELGSWEKAVKNCFKIGKHCLHYIGEISGLAIENFSDVSSAHIINITFPSVRKNYINLKEHEHEFA
jgi:hypothetical protein